ncbi:DNA polymerase I [Rhodothermaceae bacterium RA]|nr:DNA polymerase I [Rhodothermaceae bacterium RA]
MQQELDFGVTPAGAVPPAPAGDGAGKRLYLLDAMALAYRAHFIFISRPLINSKGQNTSATFGFTNALVKLIQDHQMDHMAVVFDVMEEGGTFRDALYDAYKAHRDPPPQELLDNLPMIKEIVRAMDIPVVEIGGVEADDVIGTLAVRAAADGAEVVIVSPDKDFQQLLGPRISIFRPSYRGEDFDPITAERFREKYGLEPRQFIDVLALWGDSSDNVPGVPLIGEKTAVKLLQTYPSLEDLIAHADEIGGKRGQNLKDYAEQARISKQLVTIKTDVDIDLDWHTLHRANPDFQRLTALFEAFEFRRLAQKAREGTLFGAPAADATEAATEAAAGAPAEDVDRSAGPDETLARLDEEQVDYRIVRNRETLAELAQHLDALEQFAFDTETTSTDPMLAGLVGVSVAWAPRQAWYVPTPLPDGTPVGAVLEALRPVLARETVRKIGQNLKYDILVLARHGVPVRGPLFDTMVAHYLLAPEEEHNLDALARKILHYRMVPIERLIGTGKAQKSMVDVPLDEIGPYACEDADITLRLAAPLRDQLQENGLLEIAETMEFPLIYVLVDMERAGVRIDPAVLQEISAQLDQEMAALEQRIYEVAGETFNINSTQQLAAILFDKLGLQVGARTSTGKPSTKESVLEELSTEHELPGLILDWRKLSKLKSTYVDSLGDLIHPETGRVHTSFNQTITATGRLSSSNPNLQNIPVRTEMGREIRKAFVPAEGHRLVAADYVQIELRILASMSGDENLIHAFEAGEDIHTATAARVFGVEPEAVTRDQRRKAKEVNYGIPYGVSAWGLAQRLRCSVSEAQALIDQYQRSYPKVSRFLAEQVERAREKGYVETKLGRRRFVPGINARNRNERSFYERVAVNMPIQGTQADMIKIAMVRIHEGLRREGLRSRMVLQVHDELVFEAPEDEVDRLTTLVEEEMVRALPLDVPIEVDIKAADNWLDAH